MPLALAMSANWDALGLLSRCNTAAACNGTSLASVSVAAKLDVLGLLSKCSTAAACNKRTTSNIVMHVGCYCQTSMFLVCPANAPQVHCATGTRLATMCGIVVLPNWNILGHSAPSTACHMHRRTSVAP